MLISTLLLLTSVSIRANSPPSRATTEIATVETARMPEAEQLMMSLARHLTPLFAKHPQIKRAYLLLGSGPTGPTYTLVPIFDREVSDEALTEARATFRALAPAGTELQMMLLARNGWKRAMAGHTPFYERAK